MAWFHLPMFVHLLKTPSLYFSGARSICVFMWITIDEEWRLNHEVFPQGVLTL
jgi:hypothetical protein